MKGLVLDGDMKESQKVNGQHQQSFFIAITGYIIAWKQTGVRVEVGDDATNATSQPKDDDKAA